MKHTKSVLAMIAVMAAMLVVFAAPALADDRRDHHDNDRFFSSNSEQEADSGDVDQSFEVTDSGDNSNQTAGIQGVANTGNVQNQISFSDTDGFDGNDLFNNGDDFCDDLDGDDFCDDLEDFCDDNDDDGFCDDFFDDNNRFFFDDNGFGNFEFGEVGSSIEVSPTNTTSSNQDVDQAATAAG
jgi:hypothetical protein